MAGLSTALDEQLDGSGVRFRVLGPLELRVANTVQVIHSARQRSVLALLLARANQVVPLDALIDEVWNGRPPASARSAIHVHLGGIRRLLCAAGASPLRTHPCGYLLSVTENELDVLWFSRLVARGRAALAAGRATEAADALHAALSVWRGPALADVPVESLQLSVVPQWEEARLTAIEDRIDADLRCCRHGPVVGEIQALVAAHPMRERLHGQLMLALYRSGRQTEALCRYREVRRMLIDELGVEPGPELRRLECAILNADPALDLPRNGSSLLGPLPRSRNFPPTSRISSAAVTRPAGGSPYGARKRLPRHRSW